MKRKLIGYIADLLQRLVRRHWWLGQRVMDIIAERGSLKTYLGHGDFDEENGWWFFGEWISADN